MSEHRKQMVSGEWCVDHPELQEQRRRCARLLHRFNSTRPDEDEQRHAVLGELLGSIGPGSIVMPRFTCSYGDQITVGVDALVNHDCLFMDDAAIEIGDNVLVGPPAKVIRSI